MKKSLVALTVAALAASSANATITLYQDSDTKVSLYGSVRLLLAKNNNNRGDLYNDQSRFWLNVQQRISDDFYAIGATQIRPQTPYDDNFSSGIHMYRLYAGFKWDGVGELTFGNQSTMANQFKLADFTYKFGGVTRAGIRYTDQDSYRTFGRPQYGIATSGKKVIHFQSADMNGFTFGGDYILGSNSAYHDEKGNDIYDNTSYQVGVKYYNRFDDYRVKANVITGYSRIKPGFSTHHIGAAVGFGYKSFDIGLDWLHDTDSKYNKTESQTAWQLGVRYFVTYPWSVYGAYRQTEFTDQTTNRGFAIGTDYRWTKRVKTFIEYATNKADNVYFYKKSQTYKYPTERQHGYYMGMRVDF